MNKTTAEVNDMIASIGLPYAYYAFPPGDKPKPPYLCFFYPRWRDFEADGENYAYINELHIRKYSSYPDLHGDRAISRVLNANGLVCEGESWYDEDEHIWVTEIVANVPIREP